MTATVLLFVQLLVFSSAAWAQTPKPGAKELESQVIHLVKDAMDGALSLTLTRAVELALERNPALTVERIRVEQAREKIQEEKGFYDPLFNIRGMVERKDNVVASRFYPTGLYVDKERAHGFSLEAKTGTGGRFSLGLDYKRLASSSNTQTLSPQYSANLAFTFTHALLRDFGIGVNTTRIRLAEKSAGIAEHVLQQRVSQLIQQVEEVYWGVNFLRQDLDWKRKSLDFARTLVRRSEDLERAGLVAPVSVLEARSGVAAREETLILAESEARKFEDRLRLLLHLDFANTQLSVVDRLSRDMVELDAAKSLQLALNQRPEILGLQKELEQRALEKKFAENQTLPRLDLTTQYGMTGLSGKPNPTCVDPTAIVCSPVGSNVNGSIFENQTRGSDAFDRFFTRNPFDNWSVELKLQIPLWNTTAKAQLSQANLRYAESQTRLRQVRDQIDLEIRDAIREVTSADKRIDAAKVTVKYTEEQLDAMRRKLEAGLTTSYEVLQVLDDLDKARTNEIKSLMDYNVGQTKLRLAEASVLEKYNIELKKPPRYEFR